MTAIARELDLFVTGIFAVLTAILRVSFDHAVTGRMRALLGCFGHG
jgi:hypothetical protein